MSAPRDAHARATDVAHWRRVQSVLEQLDALPADARAARLEALTDDERVRADVRRALDDEAVPEGFLDRRQLAGDRWLPAGTGIGPFELVRPLATGGMGTVYEARQRAPRRTVALKLLHTGLADERARRRFVLEAEVLARLHHPHVAQVHEAGIHRPPGGGPGIPWYAMELVPGARDLLTFAREEDLPLDGRLALFEAFCEAVEAGHRVGVLHRDLKPSNMLVDRDGRPRVIDFGVARVAAGDPGDGQDLTRSGELLGTLRVTYRAIHLSGP